MAEVSYRIIGRNIQRQRKAHGHTQAQAAERLGISTLHYGRLERGERPASLDQLAQIAQLYGVSLHVLLDGAILIDGQLDRQLSAQMEALPETDVWLLADLYAVIRRHRAGGINQDAERTTACNQRPV